MIRVKLDNEKAKDFTELDLANLSNELDIRRICSNLYSLIYKNKSYEISVLKIDRESKSIELSIDSIKSTLLYNTKMDLLLQKMGIDFSVSNKLLQLKAPMPGMVLEWFVKEGDRVIVGDKLLILEAMKMENVIKSTGDGIIKKIHIHKGTAVEKNKVLIDFH